MPHDKLGQCEIKIHRYEHLYQQEVKTFEFTFLNTNFDGKKRENDMLITLVKTYLNHHTNKLIRKIRYKEACLYANLLRQHCRHSLSKREAIGVYPQIIVDVSRVSLNCLQLDYLPRNGMLINFSQSLLHLFSPLSYAYIMFVSFYLEPNYIRPNQSYLYSYERRYRQVKKEHKNMMDVIIPFLVRVHYIPNTSTIIKQFSQQLEACLYQRYMAPKSYLDIYRSRKELKIVKSIRHRLKKEKYILRVTDKSGIFRIGHAKAYETKAETYRQKTRAYIELESNPLWTVFDKVVHLLNDLRSKKHIQA